jgi:hypothetical protein
MTPSEILAAAEAGEKLQYNGSEGWKDILIERYTVGSIMSHQAEFRIKPKTKTQEFKDWAEFTRKRVKIGDATWDALLALNERLAALEKEAGDE